jgi:hypothetical protein
LPIIAGCGQNNGQVEKPTAIVSPPVLSSGTSSPISSGSRDLPPPDVGIVQITALNTQRVDTRTSSESWTPGEEHPEYTNVVASEDEGYWQPSPGYGWIFPDDEADLSVLWVTGAEHPTYPNVIAAEEEGNWYPAPGYTWLFPDDEADLSVFWVTGAEHPTYPNVIAAEEEGNWYPAPGFRWASDDPSDFSVIRE